MLQKRQDNKQNAHTFVFLQVFFLHFVTTDARQLGVVSFKCLQDCHFVVQDEQRSDEWFLSTLQKEQKFLSRNKNRGQKHFFYRKPTLDESHYLKQLATTRQFCGLPEFMAKPGLGIEWRFLESFVSNGNVAWDGAGAVEGCFILLCPESSFQKRTSLRN